MYYLGYTIIEVPHVALGGEMARGYEERVSVMGWRMAFSNVGLFVGAAVTAS